MPNDRDKDGGTVASNPPELERELERAREMLRVAVDATPDVYFVKDWDHRLLLVSRSLADAMNTTPTVMEGKLDTEFWPAQVCEGDPETGRRGYHDEDRQALAGASFRSTERVKMADGVEHVFYTDRAPLRDSGGEVFGVLGYARDVTETLLLEQRTAELEAATSQLRRANTRLTVEVEARTRAEASLKAANDELATLVGHRTNELSNEIANHQRTRGEHEKLQNELRHMQRLESLGTLAGGIAHDFNNLLTVVGVNVEMALNAAGAGSESSKFLHEIEEAASSAAELTQQILAFSRKQVLHTQHLNLNEVIETQLGLLHRSIGGSHEIDVIPGSELGTITADPRQLQNVLINLCVNARDAMPNGGRITIETSNVLVDSDFVRMHPWATRGRCVLLTVSDQGIGMDDELRGRIFEPFFTTKDAGRGTGLGLASVYGVVRQHDGMINVYSEPGEGTVFKIYLPIVKQIATQVSNTARSAGPGGHERVLVADDQAGIVRVVSASLRLAGYRVTSVEGGAAALSALIESPDAFDLAVLDAVMPGTGGPQIVAVMRKMAPKMRFLVMSGYAATHSEMSNSEWLSKPFTAEQLLMAVRRSLDE
jgi:signal transduction histidine kinase